MLENIEGQDYEMKIIHHDGGANYFSSERRPKGVRMILTPVKISGNIKEFSAMSGFNNPLFEYDRKSNKKIQQAEELLVKHGKEIAKAFHNKNNGAVLGLLESMREELKKPLSK